MPQVVTIHWQEQTLECLVLRVGIAHSEVTAQLSIPAEGLSTKSLGKKLAEALAKHCSGRLKVIAVVDHNSLQWQHLSLPPCPEEELVDLVLLQSGQEEAPADDPNGFDFLPLSGDQHTPHRVQTVSLSKDKLKQLGKLCKAAHLELKRVVPLSLGWPALVRYAQPQQATTLIGAIGDGRVILWVSTGDTIVSLRQLQLPLSEDGTVAAKMLQTELQRTMLALDQAHLGQKIKSLGLVGSNPDNLAALAQQLQGSFELSVWALDVAKAVPAGNVKMTHHVSSALRLPMVGLALDEAAGVAPSIDLLHPHRRPIQQITGRTYALAAAAIVSLCMLLGWSGYSSLNSPLRAAVTSEATLAQLEKSLDEAREYEQQASDIRTWLDQSANLLHELDRISEIVRPQPLTSEEFSAEDDVVVSKLTLEKSKFSLEAFARSITSIQQFENRVRSSGLDLQRDNANPKEQLPDYPWEYKATVDLMNVDTPAAGGDQR